jgi:hypothetical protein
VARFFRRPELSLDERHQPIRGLTPEASGDKPQSRDPEFPSLPSSVKIKKPGPSKAESAV